VIVNGFIRTQEVKLTCHKVRRLVMVCIGRSNYGIQIEVSCKSKRLLNLFGTIPPPPHNRYVA